jgi:hypothetical protein
VSQLEELTSHDQEIYEVALERFHEQWSRYQAQPRRAYSIGAHMRHATIPPVQAALQPLRRIAKRILGK